MFDDLATENILTFYPEARFINRQFMKNYSYVYENQNKIFTDIPTASYCLLNGADVTLHDFSLITYASENEEQGIKDFVNFMLYKVSMMTDEEKMILSDNIKKIYKNVENFYNNKVSTIPNSQKYRKYVHLLFDDIMKACEIEN